jgi:hypothetical protein
VLAALPIRAAAIHITRSSGTTTTSTTTTATTTRLWLGSTALAALHADIRACDESLAHNCIGIDVLLTTHKLTLLLAAVRAGIVYETRNM